jgi:RNase H-like domain found in reverse transcriptase
VVPLTRLTWKNIPWNFDKLCKLAFLTLFISTLVITHYKPGCPLVIETNASDYALAAILPQVEPNGEIYLVTYLSRLSWTLNLTTTHMTRNLWQFMKHLRLGIITLKALRF